MQPGGVEILLVEDNVSDAELTLRALRPAKNRISNGLTPLAQTAISSNLWTSRHSPTPSPTSGSTGSC